MIFIEVNGDATTRMENFPSIFIFHSENKWRKECRMAAIVPRMGMCYRPCYIQRLRCDNQGNDWTSIFFCFVR